MTLYAVLAHIQPDAAWSRVCGPEADPASRLMTIILSNLGPTAAEVGRVASILRSIHNGVLNVLEAKKSSSLFQRPKRYRSPASRYQLALPQCLSAAPLAVLPIRENCLATKRKCIDCSSNTGATKWAPSKPSSIDTAGRSHEPLCIPYDLFPLSSCNQPLIFLLLSTKCNPHLYIDSACK
jgi:hypothetical protein